MASFPKKPRTEEGLPADDAPAVDEQPRTEEMLDADGDPPVEEPRPEEESSTDGPPVRPPPRLRMKARKCVQGHMTNTAADTDEDENSADEGEHEDLFVGGEDVDFFEEEEVKWFVRVLLVNQRWLDSFFDAADIGTAQITVAFGLIALGKFGDWPLPLVITPAGVASLLRLSRNLTEIGIRWNDIPAGGKYAPMHEWMEVASALQALPNLTTIRLTAWPLKHAYTDMLVDSLPDCLLCVNTSDLRIATLLRKRQISLQSVDVSIGGRQSYFADVLRLNSACIKLWWKSLQESSYFHLLHGCGPLARNEQLQELYINARLFTKGDIRKALHHLRGLKDHFKLVFFGVYRVCLEEALNLQYVEGIAEKTKELAALMSQAGFGSGAGEVRIVIEDLAQWQHVEHRQVFKRLVWKRNGEIPWPEYSKSLPTCSRVHKNVRILIGLNRF